MIKYVSTRGQAPALRFGDVLLAGLALDGGLYVPQRWPRFSKKKIADLAGLRYHEAAFEVMWPFVEGALPESSFKKILKEAYASFGHSVVAPLVQIGDEDWLLELFHGPTLAFKDVAMQVLSRLMDRELKSRKARVTIVCATSGDTGGAAVEAFRGRDAIDVFVLHPHGRVSEVQRRQMTTPGEDNVHNIALQGTFDDCQALVKAMFNDHPLRDELQLAGVNSINWARIVAQIVYYFTAAVALGAPHRKVSFSVPTGNFGDIFAGYAAHCMGLPVSRFVIATNVNDILARTLKTGRYKPANVVATASPSMDIQISSNFERLLFEMSGRDSGRVNRLMAEFQKKGSFGLVAKEQEALRSQFAAQRITEKQTADTIKRLYLETGYVADPHSAVGIGAARKLRKSGGLSGPVVSLATAHPAKFSKTVEHATGCKIAFPDTLAAQNRKTERYKILPNDYKAVSAFIRQRARAAGEARA